MDHKVTLSSVFNMSLGFVPVVIAMVLCQFIPVDIAIYVSATASLSFSLLWLFSARLRAVNYVLHISTVLLLIYSLLLAGGWLHHISVKWMPFSLEIGMIVLLGIFYLLRGRIVGLLRKRAAGKRARALMQGVDSTVVAIQVLFILSLLHLLMIAITGLVTFSPVGRYTTIFLYGVFPPFVFVLCMLFNQYGLRFFNKVMSQTRYISVVDSDGRVVGRALKLDATEYKNQYTNPVIRIIPIVGNMIFLSRRPADAIFDQDKADTPMETFLSYDEKIEHGVKRLINEAFPGVKGLEPTFTVKYHLKNEETSRLIYLFTLVLNDGSLMSSECFGNGKLWTLPLIEQNLHKNYFATSFEDEYELLKEIIDTREKYKVS